MARVVRVWLTPVLILALGLVLGGAIAALFMPLVNIIQSVSV